MKIRKLSVLPIFLLFIVSSCSDDWETTGDASDMLEEQEQNLLIGDWTAISIGVVYDDDTEDSTNDPCGTFQNVKFLEDGTWESDNYVLDNEACMFSGTWSGTYLEMDNENFPEANYELVIEQDGGEGDLVRYPEITFDGEDTMRIQYQWTGPGNTIAYSFTLYERD